MKRREASEARRPWRFDHHPPCPGGCGELADECTCPNPEPVRVDADRPMTTIVRVELKPQPRKPNKENREQE
jgi:hypothetical protein